MGKEGITSFSLWRWNDRLAWVAGGLTLFLLGIVTGRVFGPDPGSDSIGGEPVAVVSTASPMPETAIAHSPEAETFAEEVNPPELIVDTQPTEPIVTPDNSAPSAKSVAASETTEASPPIADALPATSPPPAAAPQTFPVSLEGKVPTIKPLASTQVCAPAKKFKDRKLSTALTWAESVQEASQQAEENEKLVFLIHVSGNFEMPGFT